MGIGAGSRTVAEIELAYFDGHFGTMNANIWIIVITSPQCLRNDSQDRGNMG